MGESVRTSKEMLDFNKKVNAELTPIDLLTQVRERLKLTQQQAAKVFGGGPNAFSRYESGKTKPPVALVKLLKVLYKHPDLFDEIAEADDRMTVSRVSRLAGSKRKRRGAPLDHRKVVVACAEQYARVVPGRLTVPINGVQTFLHGAQRSTLQKR